MVKWYPMELAYASIIHELQAKPAVPSDQLRHLPDYWTKMQNTYATATRRQLCGRTRLSSHRSLSTI